MAPYRVRLYDENGGVETEYVVDFAHDDDAIDRVGDSEHPHAMDIWEGDRHVARFPPWRAPAGRRELMKRLN